MWIDSTWQLAHITAWWDHPMQCSIHYDLISIDWMVTALGVLDADENGCIRKDLWVFIKMKVRVRKLWKPKKKEIWDRKQNEERKWKLYFITLSSDTLHLYLYYYRSYTIQLSKWIPPCDWMYNEHQFLRI